MDEPPPQDRAVSPSAGPLSIDQQIADASNWCVALGAVSLIAGFFQLVGVVDPGVPVWLNLAVPIALIALGLRLHRRALLSAGVLVVLFLAMIVNTLIVTGAVFRNGGVLLTGLLIVRYLILVNAARALGRAFFGLLEFQRTEVSPAAFAAGYFDSRGSASPAPSHNASAAAPAALGPGFNGAVAYFACCAAFAAIVGLATLAFGPFQDPRAPVFIRGLPFVLLLCSGGMAYAAVKENEFFPQKVGELRKAVDADDQAQLAKLKELLRGKGRRASRALAIAALDARSEPKASSFIVAALDMIGDIGILEKDAAAAIHAHFIERENDDAAREAARRALRSLGYEL